MKIEFLGTGGAMAIPRPLCKCRVCSEARKIGVPYSRSGPSLFIHGPNILIDTPEDIYFQINRSSIERIDGVLYSHWHPDHIMGRRILESLNADWRSYPPNNKHSDVYLPEQVAIDFRHRLGMGDHLSFFSKQGYINIHELKDGEAFSSNGVVITPFRLEEPYVYAFLVEDENYKMVIAPDELNNWKPDDSLNSIDLAILPMGVAEYHPLTGERQIPQEHPVLQEECTFIETVEIIKRLKPKRTILTHIEESDGLSFDDFKEIENNLKAQGLNISFAYDTLIVDLE